MAERSIPINGGSARLRADVAERHGIAPNATLDWRALMPLRDEEYALRQREREADR